MRVSYLGPRNANFLGTWYFKVRGSGVWLQVGNRSQTVEGPEDYSNKDGVWLRAARARGVDTVQAPLSSRNKGDPMPCQRFEVIDLRHGDGETVACAAPYRAGFFADAPCGCEEAKGYANCAKRRTPAPRAPVSRGAPVGPGPGCPGATELARARVPRLGILAARGAQPAWDAYLDRVYGRAAYPADLDAFEWFYAHAPLDVRPAAAHPRCRLPPGTAWTGPGPAFPEFLLSKRAAGFFVQRGVIRPAAANGTWIEVAHVAQRPAKPGTRGALGVWYFCAEGTGLWLNVGARSLEVGGDVDWRIVPDLVHRRDAGVTTVQAPSSASWGGLNNRFELLDLRAGDRETAACAADYRGGHGESPCACDEALGYANCAGATGVADLASHRSPDRRCAWNLTALGDLWTMRLPVFRDSGALAASPWDDYVSSVYGDVRADEFPLDLRCLTFFYHARLPQTVRPLFEAHRHTHAGPPRNGDVLEVGSSGLAWEVYVWETADFPVPPDEAWPSSERIWSTNGLVSAPAPGSWVEIWHDFDDCRLSGAFFFVPFSGSGGPRSTCPPRQRRHRTGRHGGNRQVGYWAWLAPGTGIFARLGDRTLAAARARRGTLNAYIRHVRVLNTHQRTAVVPSAVGRVAATQRIPAQAGRGYQDACAALAPGDPACRKCCAPAHVALRTAALETRWDSLVSCCGRRGAHPQRRFEITFFRPECPAMRAAADRGGCPGPEVPLRRARASNGTCACDPRSAAVNCGRGCGDEGVENRSY